MAEKMNPKKRAKKATVRQIEIMAEYINNHKEMITGKLSNTFTARDREHHWKELSQLLNSDGSGPEKRPEKWRKVS